jgi:hypothetical protein
VLIENLRAGDLPEELAGTWQIVQLVAGRDHVMLRAVLPITHEEAHVTFSAEGLAFGRGAPIVAALDTLRGLRDGAPPRLLVILGASGAGKSSFLRAGLFPRLARDDRTFFPRCRRLAKDWENLNRNALAFLKLASIRLMLRKLCNA